MEGHITRWEHQYEFRSGKWTETDYNFETPSTSLLATTSTVVSLPDNSKYELFDYPGDYLKTADGLEVDFHVRYRDGGRELLQVCADTAAEQTRERELRALGSAMKEAPKLPAALLVQTQEQALALAGNSFSAWPAYEWMLSDRGDRV